MTKRVHPAESSRKLVGAAAGIALVGIVTGFQVSAHAQESQVADPAPVPSSTPSQTTIPAPQEAVPAPAPVEQPVQQSAPVQQEQVTAPAPVAVPAAPAAPVVPAAPVAPAAPVNGTTAGSGG